MIETGDDQKHSLVSSGLFPPLKNKFVESPTALPMLIHLLQGTQVGGSLQKRIKPNRYHNYYHSYQFR